jgi:hypothetical protein
MNAQLRVGVLCAFLWALLLSACVSLVSPYDPVFDQSLNKLSDDTAVFLAGVTSGGPERSFSSRETIAYYATTYNVLDRLSERARATRGVAPCPTNAQLAAFAQSESSRSALPDDYQSFDCREYQLYSIRFYVDQLYTLHESDGQFKKLKAVAAGRNLQASIISAIDTFMTNKAGQ